MTEDLVDQRLALARHLHDTGAWDRADEVLDSLAADAIEREAYWVLRARLAYARDEDARLIEVARAGLARFPQSVTLLVLLGHGHIYVGDLVRAEEVLLAALAIDPESVAALCKYARVCAQAGQPDKARRLIDRAAEIEPESAAVTAARYHLASFAGDDRETARLAAELARATGANAHSLALVGIEAMKRGDAAGGEEMLRRAATTDVRVVEGNAELYREARVHAHPLLWPLWPVRRFGPGPVWAASMGTILAIRTLANEEAAGAVAVVYLAWVVYTWVAPLLVRRWVDGGRA